MKTIYLATVVCLSLLVGCSSSKDSDTTTADSSKQPNSATFDTPQAAFTAFSDAMAGDDLESAISMITEESQEMLVFGLVMQSAFLTMEDEAKGKDLESLFKKHGLDDSVMDEQPGPEDSFELSSLTQGLPAFVGELSAWINAHDKESENGFPKMGELTDVNIEGDKATGVANTESGKQPIEFQKLQDSWKVHLAMGPPPVPSIDELGLDFDQAGEGSLGSMRLGENSSGLNHVFAYRASFFDEPCIMLILTAIEVSEEKRSELAQQLKEDPENAFFFADGPNVSLTLTPDAELMAMNAWIDNSSISRNRGPAIEIEATADRISGRVGMVSSQTDENELQFQAKFDTEISF